MGSGGGGSPVNHRPSGTWDRVNSGCSTWDVVLGGVRERLPHGSASSRGGLWVGLARPVGRGRGVGVVWGRGLDDLHERGDDVWVELGAGVGCEFGECDLIGQRLR